MLPEVVTFLSHLLLTGILYFRVGLPLEPYLISAFKVSTFGKSSELYIGKVLKAPPYIPYAKRGEGVSDLGIYLLVRMAREG